MEKSMKYFLIGALTAGILIITGLCVMAFVYNCPCARSIFPTVASSASLTIENAIIVPTDVRKIDYPSTFNKPTVTRAEVIDPYCVIERDEVAYPVEYLGDYEYPQVNGAPLPVEIKRVVGLHDVMIPEPSLQDCSYNITEKERGGFLGTMKRAKILGADEITFTNYMLFQDFAKAELQPLERSALSPGDFRFIAANAENLRLDTTLYLNLGTPPGLSESERWEIRSGDWLATLIHNWEPFVLSQAQMCEETGIDAMMINHFDYQPYIKGFEDVYQTEMLTLLGKVRKVYHGRILLNTFMIQGADLNKLSLLINSVDGFILNASTWALQYNDNKTVSVSNLRGLYIQDLRYTVSEFSRFNKPYLIRVLVQSEKTFLENSWNEDMFPVSKGNDTYYQQHLEVDFSVQAIAYEAMLEAVAQVHNEGSMSVYGFETNGYLFMDVMLPHVSQPQISQSVRDKPAEAVIYQWFKRPADIVLNPLQITKTSVKLGEEVEITAKLVNAGDLPGNYTIIFSLDGVEKGSFLIKLDGRETTTKSMRFTSDVEGIHRVSVGNESVTFEVKKVQTGISGYPIESVLIGVILIAITLIHRTRVR